MASSTPDFTFSQKESLRNLFINYLNNPLDYPFSAKFNATKDNKTEEIVFTWRAKMPIMEFGKYKGTDWKDVPADYLQWLIDKNQQQTDLLKMELKRRDDIASAKDTVKQKIIKAGYRTLSKEVHPDTGGSVAEFQALQQAFEALKEVK